jgi:hypothetical protein
MVLVARDQQNGVVVAARVKALYDDLSTIIDFVRLIQLKARAGRNQSI